MAVCWEYSAITFEMLVLLSTFSFCLLCHWLSLLIHRFWLRLLTGTYAILFLEIHIKDLGCRVHMLTVNLDSRSHAVACVNQFIISRTQALMLHIDSFIEVRVITACVELPWLWLHYEASSLQCKNSYCYWWY